MPKIEELKDACLTNSRNTTPEEEEAMAKITLAAIEDAARYKKDENGQWWFLKSDNWRVSVKWEEIPAAVRAVLEVTGGGE